MASDQPADQAEENVQLEPAMRAASLERRQQFGRRLRERREDELGFTERKGGRAAFERATGWDTRNSFDIEKAKRANFKEQTLRRACRAYQVTRKSMRAFLEGVSDELAAVSPPALPLRLPGGLGELALVDDARKAQAYPHFAAIMKRLDQLAEARGVRPRDVTGTELFGPATADAATWDDERLRRLFTPSERAEMIADLRVREAQHANGRGIA